MCRRLQPLETPRGIDQFNRTGGFSRWKTPKGIDRPNCTGGFSRWKTPKGIDRPNRTGGFSRWKHQEELTNSTVPAASAAGNTKRKRLHL